MLSAQNNTKRSNEGHCNSVSQAAITPTDHRNISKLVAVALFSLKNTYLYFLSAQKK
jgi:hypothetical protein